MNKLVFYWLLALATIAFLIGGGFWVYGQLKKYRILKK